MGFSAIVVAAGSGSRAGGGKQWRIVAGKPYSNRTIEALLYFGAPTANSEGLEDVYANLSALEAQILAVLKTLKGRYVETITDEDRLPLYKLMVIRCELQEAPHHTSGGGLAAQPQGLRHGGAGFAVAGGDHRIVLR